MQKCWLQWLKFFETSCHSIKAPKTATKERVNAKIKLTLKDIYFQKTLHFGKPEILTIGDAFRPNNFTKFLRHLPTTASVPGLKKFCYKISKINFFIGIRILSWYSDCYI
jgi:hypothetical protein